MIKTILIASGIICFTACETGEEIDAREYSDHQRMVEEITFHNAHGKCWAVLHKENHNGRGRASGLALVPDEMCEENELGAIPR